MHIFLDESDDFTKHNHEEYFIIGSFTVGDQRRTNKALIKLIRTKFPRKMRGQGEVKWSSTGIDDNLRLRTLKHIAATDIRIHFGFLLRKNIPTSYRNKKNKINTGILYTNIVAEVLEQYLPIDDKEIHIFCDQKHLKGMTKKNFEDAIILHLAPFCSPNTLIEVKMIDSKANRNIQIADWISGAIARYFEKGRLGEESFKILKNNFIGEGKEFFN
jgi:hypothetical protein